MRIGPTLACLSLFATPPSGWAQNATHPNSERIVVLSDPPGIQITEHKTKLGKTPVTVRRRPSEWEGIRTTLTLSAVPAGPDQCAQHREFSYDQAAPDTIVFDMHKCPSPDQDFSRVFTNEDVDVLPTRLSNPPLDYPDKMFNKRISGIVIVETVIDTSGHAEEPATRVLLYNEEAFAKSALQAVALSVYQPAELLGRKVRVRVKVPITFTIRR